MTDATDLCRGFGRGAGPRRSRSRMLRPPGRRSMRRLAEKPANLRFFLRSMVSKG
ncbi:hypothetical protein AB0M11_38030 [Streptomyces sp. NPDC051987]|uniref:hypothetical protein n=1 Tax=Streptomyces sp. NPDC051987 TaxID=3155808 RepID=UPI003417CB02